MNILAYIFSCLYFFLPAYFVNMVPPLLKRMGAFKFLDKPIDFGKKIGGEPIFGSHKTWRGAIVGIVWGVLIALVQFYLDRLPSFQKISLLDYQKINIWVFGFLISAGAIFGDLLFAFIKRRLKIEPGAKFIPFDQTNYVIGSAIFLTPVFKIGILVWITLLASTFFLHIVFNRVGYLLGLHKNKW